MVPIGDIVSSIIVIGLIFLLVRWLTGKSSTPRTPGIRGVTQSMVETVKSAFPDVPVPNIIYSLSRTRSAQATSEEILERGFLPNPPPSFEIPYSLLPPSTNTGAPAAAQQKTTVAGKPIQSLIDRYGLSSQLPSRKGKEKEVPLDAGGPDSSVAPGTDPVGPGGVGGKWEDTKERRELGLKQRKEKMILEARRRMLEKEALAETAAAASATVSTDTS